MPILPATRQGAGRKGTASGDYALALVDWAIGMLATRAFGDTPEAAQRAADAKAGFEAKVAQYRVEMGT